MRIFGSERISSIMGRLGMTEEESIEHPMISKSIARAQKSVEAHNFDIRKHLLQYDDVMNRQREVVYGRRQAILEGEDLKNDILDMLYDLVETNFNTHAPEGVYSEEWDLAPFLAWYKEVFRADGADLIPGDKAKINRLDLCRALLKRAETAYEQKERQLGGPVLRTLERHVLLEVLDTLWKDNLYQMDQLKEGIGLHAYGQKDPLLEYKKEGLILFQQMLAAVKGEVIPTLMRVQGLSSEEPEREELPPQLRNLVESRPEFQIPGTAPGPEGGEMVQAGGNKPVAVTIRRTVPKVGRNEPCPCGSGKKYKKCHGSE
jgi:preprotein translocase subunit SecA